MRENGMPDTSERLARVEVLLETSLKNQSESRERSHALANEIQSISGRVDKIGGKVDDLHEIKEVVESTGVRVDALERAKASVITGFHIVKYVFYIMGAGFTFSIALGDKLAKLLPALGVLK